MADRTESAEIAAGFLRYLDTNDKRHLLREVLAILKNELEPQLPEIVVESAIELTAAHKQSLISTLAGRPHSGEVQFRVNPELIGGLKVIHGDQVLDTSVQSKLRKVYA
jgi:F-type H+-transporting ATPase subunit delta